MQIVFDNLNGSGELYLDVMKVLCGNNRENKTMIDFCAGQAPHTPKLGFGHRCYIDIIERDLGEENPYFIHADVLKLVDEPFYISTLWDVAICSDAIEHFKEKDAIKIIKKLNIIAKKQIYFTPLGEWMIDDQSEHPDTHKSGWTPEKLDELFPGHFNYVLFPDFHPTLGIGAFFFWHSKEDDITDIFNELRLLETLKWKIHAKN